MDKETIIEWLERSNAETLYHIERQGRTGPGLVPFIGAGVSSEFEFKNWRNLLLNAAPPRLASRIEKLLDQDKYEEAADALLKELGADGFQNMVAAATGDSHVDPMRLATGTVAMLPLLAKGPVVTTNFDRVLEKAFEVHGAPFESVISGPRPDLIVDALHGDRHVLIKLHGDWQDRVGRTFAKSDYDNHYGEAHQEEKRALLTAVVRMIFTSRSMFFIGASLQADRTVDLLKEVHEEYAGIRHFAIMKAPLKITKLNGLEKHLRDCGVLPLWYWLDEKSTVSMHRRKVAQLLHMVIERISIQTIKSAMKRQAPPQKSAKPAGVIEIIHPEHSSDIDPHFDHIARLIEDGRITFFLGAAIHHGANLLAADFYQNLARTFKCEALKSDGSTVAQYIADRHGREELYSEIRKLLENTKFRARETHDFFASWTKYCTLDRTLLPYPTVITTNYDNVLERSLEIADIPYHLLYYQSAGRHQGLFYHRDIDDGLRIIERPQNIGSFPGGFVIVKLNGGLAAEGSSYLARTLSRIPENYVTARLDFWDLASRIPDVLPAAIQETLLKNRLLFLGHGLVAPDVESLIRFAHRDHPGSRSWAVVLNKEKDVEYWRQCGVEIIDQPVESYIKILQSRLLRVAYVEAPEH